VIAINADDLPDASASAAVVEDGCGFAVDFGVLGRGLLGIG